MVHTCYECEIIWQPKTRQTKNWNLFQARQFTSWESSLALLTESGPKSEMIPLTIDHVKTNIAGPPVQ